MKSLWKSVQPLDASADYLVLVTDIPPRRRTSTLRLFRGARAVRKQLARTDGVVGFSLLAKPLAKEYVTLSVWTDEAALAAFARAQPHGELMRRLGPEMAPTTFVRWWISGAEGRPNWKQALRRLDAERRPRTVSPQEPPRSPERRRR